MNVVEIASGSYVIISNTDGKVDVVKKGTQVAYKKLPIEMM